MLNVSKTLRQAQNLHQAGNLDGAASLYEQILQVHAGHAEACHGLGVVDLQRGRFDKASQLLAAARTADPTNANYLLHHGIALHASAQLDQAAGAFAEAVRLIPGLAQAHDLLGQVRARQGKPAQAVESYQRALKYQPFAPVTLTNMAAALIELKRWHEAEKCLEDAIRVQPNTAEAHSNLAVVRLEQKRIDEAIACCGEAIQLNPQLPQAYNNLGAVCLDQARYEEAATQFEQALRLQPNDSLARTNLAVALYGLSRLDEATACLQEVLRAYPMYARALVYQGLVLVDQGDLEGGLEYQERAIEADPNYPEAYMNRGLIRLLKGDFAGGWADYEWRFRSTEKYAPRISPHGRWDARPLPGKTILLHAEQGLGDTLQFIRYAALVRERCGHVIVQCQPPLLGLVAGCAGVDQVIGDEVPLPPFDAQATLLGLPAIFRTDLNSIPGKEPYLSAPADLVGRWRQHVAKLPGFRVGIAWQGNPLHKRDQLRSVPLAAFEPLAHIAGVCLVSLQKGVGTEQLAALAGRFPVSDLGGRTSGDMADFAALVKCLDLVVTVDSALAHLAGALGVPVWVALPLVADWRWLLDREDSPWYPTMKLFRQQQAHDWGDVFARIAEALRAQRSKVDC